MVFKIQKQKHEIKIYKEQTNMHIHIIITSSSFYSSPT